MRDSGDTKSDEGAYAANPTTAAVTTLARFDQHDALIWTCSGEAAIELALALLDIGPGDRVLVPSCHCPTMIAPIVRAGAEPVFYPLTTCGSPDSMVLGSIIDSATRAMLAAHFFGIKAALAESQAICEQHGIVLIEDCAHSFFQTPTAPLAIASLTKFFAAPDGGCLRVNDPTVLARARSRRIRIARSAGITSTVYRFATTRVAQCRHELRSALQSVQSATLAHTPTASRHLNTLGAAAHVIRAWCASRERPCALGNFISATNGIGASRLARWLTTHSDDRRIAAIRRRNFNQFLRRFSHTRGMTPLVATLPSDCVPYVFPLVVAAADQCYARLRRIGAPVWRWDRPWPGVPAFATDMGMYWASSVLQLACHQDLDSDDINAIADAVLADDQASHRVCGMHRSEAPCETKML